MRVLEAIKDSRVRAESSNSGMLYWLFFSLYEKHSVLSVTVQYVWLDYKTNFSVISKMYLNIIIWLEIKNRAFKKMDHPLFDLFLSPILVKRTQTPATQECMR